MNTTRTPLRSLTAIAAGVALTLAACGGDDDAQPAVTTTATTEAPAAAATDAPSADVPMAPSSVAADAQTFDGSFVVASVDLPAPGFIAVHGDGGGSPGPVVGVSELLPAGASSDIEITLDAPIEGDVTLWPMVHIDTNDNGVYEFGSVEGVDGPGLTADGEVAVVPVEVTVGEEGPSGAPGGESAIEIADFAFSGVTEVAVGTTVIVTNADSAPHTWTATDGTFDSGSLATGDTFEFTFTEAGTFEYFCNIHPSMTGTITVTG